MSRKSAHRHKGRGPHGEHSSFGYTKAERIKRRTEYDLHREHNKRHHPHSRRLGR